MGNASSYAVLIPRVLFHCCMYDVDILDTAQSFQTSCFQVISGCNLDYVINTDQTGCEYRVDPQRTLDTRGVKAVEAYIGDVNKITH